jgi:hypothetical protein
MEANQPHSSISSSSGARQVKSDDHPSRHWHAGYVIPRVLLIIAILDVVLRMVPAGWRIYDVGEREVRYRIPGDAFERNLRLHSVSFGDLVRIGNLSDGEELRSSEFTTDGLGFRNTAVSRPVGGIIFGDSFAAGADRDDDTLAVQLQNKIGCGVYNAYGRDPKFQRPDITVVESVMGRVGMDRGFVIVEGVERLMFQKSIQEKGGSIRSYVPGISRVLDVLERAHEIIGTPGSQIQRFIDQSRLALVSEREIRLLKNDRILPNSYGDYIVKTMLQNDERMLFYPDEMQTYERKWPTQVSYWTSLAQDLKKTKVTFIVVLVPNKYTVYHSLLSNGPKVEVQPGELLSRLEAELRSSGIAVVNLTNALQSDAALNIDRHVYNYFREDTHWNARGIEIAAAEINRALPQLRDSCH